MTATEDTMANFNKMWYNALADGLGVSKDQFQLAQGATSLGYTSDKIWQIFDAIPPVSANNYFNPAQHNSLAENYGAVINNLIPQNDDSVRKELGNKYNDWIKYQDTDSSWTGITIDPENPKEALLTVFKNWAIRKLDTDKFDDAVTVMSQEDIVTVAVAQLKSAKKKYGYTAGYTDLKDAINKGESKKVELNTKTTSKDTSHSWAKGRVSGGYRFFSADANGHWDKFTQDIETKGINLVVEYQKVGTLVGSPYAIKSEFNSDLSGYMPWWNSAALKVAKENNNNKVWKHTAPSCDNTFGSEGNLRWLTTALIVADGIKTTMTSTVSVAKENRQEVEASVKAGYWPFFKAEAEGGWSHKVNFNDDGTFTVTSSSKEGNPTVIGVLVSPIEKILG
jgi:hypothetical protein